MLDCHLYHYNSNAAPQESQQHVLEAIRWSPFEAVGGQPSSSSSSSSSSASPKTNCVVRKPSHLDRRELRTKGATLTPSAMEDIFKSYSIFLARLSLFWAAAAAF
jgi:hypothetical protein